MRVMEMGFDRLIGYVAHNLTLGTSASRTVRLRNANDEVLRRLIIENLTSLRRILEWNALHGIKMFRITSDLIPYATHEVNRIPWWEEFNGRFELLGDMIAENRFVISMHPGQYTLLSSPDREVVERSKADLRYHSRVLDLLGLDERSKIITHLGGGYGDKASAIRRWVDNWGSLGAPAASRIVIENDERIYTLEECLEVSEATGVPVVFDFLHHTLNPGGFKDYREAMERALGTWPSDLVPEIHYSDQQPGARRGSHAQTVDVPNFLRFWNETEDMSFNAMLETKDKELSVLKIYEALGISETGPLAGSS
ncbi:MAG: UV DNA damage repair endonuclease UvsE [Candidatus Aquicultorales bacterium]